MSVGMWRLCLCALVLLLIAVPPNDAKGDFELQFETFNCSGGPLAPSTSCSLGKNAKRRTIGIEMKFSEKITCFHMNMLVTLPRRSGNFVLLNLTNVDGCDLLANKRQVTLVMLFRASLFRFGNIPSACPLHQDVDYYVRGYRFDLDNAPAFDFETAIIVSFEFVAGARLMLSGELGARVALKGGRQVLELLADAT